MRYSKYRPLVMLVIVSTFAVAYGIAPDIRRVIGTLQLTPSLLAMGWAAFFAMVVIAFTVLRGRVYCSILCPAGIVQEFAFRVGRFLRLSKVTYVRGQMVWVILITVAVSLVLGFGMLGSLLDPLGWFGKLVSPVAEAVKDVVYGSEYASGYLGISGLAFFFALGILVVVSLFRGRWFCDRLCPVGMALGTIGTLAPNQLRLDTEKCTSCRNCEKVCPTRCIDGKNKSIDTGRCVLCYSCTGSCPVNAISNRAMFSKSRRRAIAGGLAWLGTLAFLSARGLGRGIVFLGRKVTAILPPGAMDADSYYQKCIGCQSCAAACPVGIIKPMPPGMQPELRYDIGYCQYECNVCSHACPTEALMPLTIEHKKQSRIAKTNFSLDKCIVVTQQTACGACAEICPVHALVMVEQEGNFPTRPEFHPELCIGCGACLYVCPAQPSAFTITGIAKHQVAIAPQNDMPEEVQHDTGEALDFPF